MHSWSKRTFSCIKPNVQLQFVAIRIVSLTSPTCYSFNLSILYDSSSSFIILTNLYYWNPDPQVPQGSWCSLWQDVCSEYSSANSYLALGCILTDRRDWESSLCLFSLVAVFYICTLERSNCTLTWHISVPTDLRFNFSVD